MLKKLRTNHGFVLIESILCLTLLSFVLINLLPAISTMYQTRQDFKFKVEMARYLYDSAISWTGNHSAHTETYSDWRFNVQTDSGSIEVSSPEESKRLELKSVEFQK